jgi:hypothetical protein
MFIGSILEFLSYLFLATQPSGSYVGSKTVFGETIGAAVNVRDSNTLDFAISGPIDLNCVNEPYVVSGNEIFLSDIEVVGDCAHDALLDNGVVLTGIVYDGNNDQITVSVKYSIAKIELILSPKINFMTE